MLKEERGGNCHISLSNTRQPKEKMKASVFCQQEPVSCQLKRNLLCEERKTRGKNMPRNTTSILEFAFPQMVFRFSFNVTWRKKLTDSVSFLFDRRDKDNVSRFSQHVRTHRFTRLECDVIERVRMQMNIQVCGCVRGWRVPVARKRLACSQISLGCRRRLRAFTRAFGNEMFSFQPRLSLIIKINYTIFIKERVLLQMFFFIYNNSFKTKHVLLIILSASATMQAGTKINISS